MAKGGDTTTTNTTSSLPPEIAPYYSDLLGRAKTISNQGYTTYGNPRLADFSADTNQAFNDIRGIASAGTPGYDQAVNAAQGIAGYQANTIPNADLSAYMSPYTQNVLDVQKARATQTFNEQQAGRDAAAVAAGAFGGDRRFVADSLAQRDLNRQLQEMDATGLAAAFDRATGLYQNDETNRRLGAGLGLDAATALGSLSDLRRNAQLGNAEALSAVGSKIQQQKQAGLDLAYKDFLEQRDWPSKQLSLYSQLLSGTPVSPSTSTTTTEPAPDFLSQLLGLTTSGVGLAKLLGG